MTWKPEDPQGNEAAKIKFDIVPYTRGKGLDLGCGMYKTWPHFIGVDNRKQWGTELPPADEMALRMNVDIESDCEDLSLFTSHSMDFVFSSHLLEHIENTRKTLREWWRVIKVGGYLVLYLPHCDFYPNVGEFGANPDHKHDFSPTQIISIMKDLGGWTLVENENRKEGKEYSFYQVYQKRVSSGSKTFKNIDKTIEYRDKPDQITCCVVRYGGFGDQIQASSILPGLKEEGYFIYFMTTPDGYDILKHDPNIDDWIIQDKDQVPMEQLSDFWQHWSKKFDRFICLTESVEATLLVMPYRVYYSWPSVARHMMCNANYLEMVHTISEVPFPPKPHFYPSPKELKKASKRIEKYGKTILWCIDGSSVHKHWPWQDQALAQIMLETDYKVVLVGNSMSEILEAGWENEDRILKRCGKWSIRDTLAFAQVADMVVGPETGVLNTVGMLDMPKIIFLSHSSEENLTKHWKNCYPLFDIECSCRPCHKLIYGWEGCVRESKEVMFDHRPMYVEGAKCQVGITPEMFWEAFCEATEIRRAA